MRLIKTFSILLILFLYSVPAFAIPAITDSPSTIISGESVSVVGTAMDVKTVAAPLSYLDGAGTTEGEVLNDSDYAQNSVGAFTYTADGARNGKNAVYTIIQDFPGVDHLYYDAGVSGFTDKIYCTFWTKLEPNGEWTTIDVPDQIKWISIRTQENPTGPPNAGYNIYPQFDKQETFSWYTLLGGVVYNNNYGSGVVYLQPEDWPTPDVYFRIELYGKRASGNNVADGTWVSKIIQPGNSPSGWHDTNTTITHSAVDEIWRYAGFRNQIVNSDAIQNEELKHWINGFFIDDSPNRFEIGNNIDFDLCSHREIQETTSKTATAGAFIANRGGLDLDTTYYLFTVDNSNTPSVGVEIQFSAAASTATTGISATGSSSFSATGTTTME